MTESGRYTDPTMRYDQIEVVRGSLLEVDADAIVNAANPMMRGGGGIDGRIHMAAGFKMLLELQRVAPKGCERGEVVVTPGFDLPQKWVLHTPGPRWKDGRSGEPELLRRCYMNSVLKATEMGLARIAFCSISTGVYGYPVDLAAPIAIEAVAEHGVALDRIIFAMYGAEEFTVFERILNERQG